jgi:hypothetical protein
MGQYFKAVNLDKREVVCPWCLGGGAKLWEWAVNTQGAVFTLLLRQSSGTGGGDYGGPEPQTIELTEDNAAAEFSDIIAKGIAREGMSMPIPSSSVVGRWAGDRVALIGDYDESFVWSDLEQYTNISEQLVEEWNRFVGEDEQFHLTYDRCGCTK